VRGKFLAFILLCSAFSFGQTSFGNPYDNGPNLPSTCRPTNSVGALFFKTVTDGNGAIGLYYCSAANTWTGPFIAGVLPQSMANASHKWLNSYDAATGLFTQTQPAYSDISGTPTITGSSNVLQKGNGSGGTSDSAITDNATNVSTTEAILAPVGTKSAPAYSFTGFTNYGLYNNSASSSVFLAANGTPVLAATTARLTVGANQTVGWSSGSDPEAAGPDAMFTRSTTATIHLGAASAAVPVAQTLGAQGARAGTDSDTAGMPFTIRPSLGTGLGAGDQVSLARSLMGTTGSAVHATANAITVCESKTLSNTSATTATFATIGLASNSGGGATVFITLVASDGTNFDSETQSVNLSYVNKATVMTVSTPTITASSAANNSGSATIGFTATGASPTISLKVTPVYGTIVPTTVTMYAEINNHGAGAVSCQ
jgi:hypothetical protein